MAKPDNIVFFNAFTLALFDRLYESFPVPLDVDVRAIAMSALPADAEYEQAWDALSAAQEAVVFLAEEGFLTHKGSYLEGGTFLQVRLSLKGLAILGSTPGSLEAKQTLISRARGALAAGAKEVGSEAAKQVVQQIFAAALAAAPTLVGKLAQ